MKKVLLNIIGSQLIDREKDSIEITTMGTLRDDGNAYIVRYTEEQEPPFEPINVTVRIHKNESAVEMTRAGDFGSILMIEKSKRNLCRYNTEVGNVIMGIYGKDISTEDNGDCGHFRFEYDIDFNGAVASKNTLDISYSEIQSR